jgi:hypothetical protein
MSWLELLRRRLDDDELPVMVLWPGPLGPGGENVWWSSASLPFVYCPLPLWELVHSQLLAAFGAVGVATEGEES